MHLNVPFRPAVNHPSARHLSPNTEMIVTGMKFSQSYSAFLTYSSSLSIRPYSKVYDCSLYKLPSTSLTSITYRNIAYKNHVSSLETSQNNTSRNWSKIRPTVWGLIPQALSLVYNSTNSCKMFLPSRRFKKLTNSSFYTTCPSSCTQPEHPSLLM